MIPVTTDQTTAAQLIVRRKMTENIFKYNVRQFNNFTFFLVRHDFESKYKDYKMYFIF